MSKMYNVRKVAKMLDVTTYTIRNWCNNGKIKAVKIPNNSEKAQWFVSEEELARLQKGFVTNEANK